MNFTVYLPEDIGKEAKRLKLRLSPMLRKVVMKAILEAKTKEWNNEKFQDWVWEEYPDQDESLDKY